jgi:Metallo-peptidase family M12
MIPVKEPLRGPLLESSPFRIEREFVKDILSLSAEAKGSEFRATKYPMPDGNYRDLIFRSFVICRPGVIVLTQKAEKDSVVGSFHPVTQWLGRVSDKNTRADEVLSFHVQNGRVTGQASFRGHTYLQTFGDDETPTAVRYRLRGEAIPNADKLKVTTAVPSTRRFFHRDALIADLALVSDFSLTQDFGSIPAAADAMVAMVADLNAIYFRDLEVVFNLTYLALMNVGPSPYQILTRVGDQDTPATALEAFANDWNANHGDVQRDLAVLVSKHFVISAQTGVANGLSDVGTLCDRKTAYVVLTYAADPDVRTYRAAHEIGHCFGAIHTNCTPDPNSTIGFVDGCSVARARPGEPPPPCYAGPDRQIPNVPGTIMSLCPSIELRFHELSAEMIDTALASKPCLEPASFKLLQNDADEQNLGSQFGNVLYFAIDVPEHVVDFRIATTGGTGDVDLYAQRRTLSVYASWPSTNPGNDEQLVFQRPVRPGRWYIRLQPAPAAMAFAGVRLTAAYQDAVILQNNVPYTEPQLSQDDVLFFKLDVPIGAQSVTLTATHPSGQFSFFVGRNSRPDVSNVNSVNNVYYDVDPNNAMKTHQTAQGQPTVGLWYVGIQALVDVQNLTVTISYRI